MFISTLYSCTLYRRRRLQTRTGTPPGLCRTSGGLKVQVSDSSQTRHVRALAPTSAHGAFPGLLRLTRSGALVASL
eukprot:2866842-Prymnesium_polylepis.1